MNDVNVVLVQGRLTRDGELKFTNGGTAVAHFSIATNKGIPPKEEGGEWKTEVSYLDIEAWGRLAERVSPKLFKGTLVLVIGEIKQERWEQDGQGRSRVKITAQTIQVTDRNEKQEPRTEPRKEAPPAAPDDFTDDIPF